MSIEKLNRMLEFITMPGKGQHCIYRLIDSAEEVIYVGHTADLEKRIYSHLSNGKDFCFFDYSKCTKETAKEAERDAIIKYNPKLNISLPTTPEYKTEAQARKIIEECIKDKLLALSDKLTKNMPIAFDRPQVKHANHTYIKTSDIELVIHKIKSSEFIVFGED